jgi:cell division protein FtsW (lipid II flippase)
MARRTPQALTPRWRRREWNASDPPFSYEMATFYVLAHVPWFFCFYSIVGIYVSRDHSVPATVIAMNEMMFWFRVCAWMLLAWTVALGVSAWIPRDQRSRARLAIIAFAILISAELVVTAQLASISVENLISPELSGSFEFRFDPASQKWFHHP